MVIEFKQRVKTNPQSAVILSRSVILMREDDEFLALIGPNAQRGIVGFGNTVAKALRSLADRMETESYRLPDLEI
jgi:hypothetical protein